jgi:hydroxymethylbilane synthase
MTQSVPIRLGTRASALARWQAEWVAARLHARGADVVLVPIVTAGDQRREGPIGAIGQTGVFTKEIQRALLDRRIDLAVHSLKDLPTEPVEGLCLAAVPERAAAGDVLVGRTAPSLDALPNGSVVGTGSLRRRAQLLHVRPDLVLRDVRGNVDTRLRKLDEGLFDAIVLAEAGLRRLELADRITQTIPLSVLLPAVGQGALGLETRTDDNATRAAIAPLCHPATFAAVLAERAMLLVLHGGCMAPIAAWGRVENDRLLLTGRVLDPEGRTRLEATLSAAIDDAQSLGRRVADDLLGQGARPLIDAARDVLR